MYHTVPCAKVSSHQRTIITNAHAAFMNQRYKADATPTEIEQGYVMTT